MMFPIVIFLCCVSISTAYKISCNESFTCPQTLTCQAEPQESCVINCDEINSCAHRTIICSKHVSCSVNCRAESACEGTTINGSESSVLNFATNLAEEKNIARNSIVLCPKELYELDDHDTNCLIYCRDTTLPSCNNISIYSRNGFDNVIMSSYPNNVLVFAADMTVHCGLNYDYSCDIDATQSYDDQTLRCLNSGVCESIQCTYSGCILGNGTTIDVLQEAAAEIPELIESMTLYFGIGLCGTFGFILVGLCGYHRFAVKEPFGSPNWAAIFTYTIAVADFASDAAFTTVLYFKDYTVLLYVSSGSVIISFLINVLCGSIWLYSSYSNSNTQNWTHTYMVLLFTSIIIAGSPATYGIIISTLGYHQLTRLSAKMTETGHILNG